VYKGKLKLYLTIVERKGKCLLDCKTDMSNRNIKMLVLMIRWFCVVKSSLNG